MKRHLSNFKEETSIFGFKGSWILPGNVNFPNSFINVSFRSGSSLMFLMVFAIRVNSRIQLLCLVNSIRCVPHPRKYASNNRLYRSEISEIWTSDCNQNRK